VAQESVLATCRHMLERFRAGRPAETSAADNLKTLALAEAAYESAARAGVVTRGLLHKASSCSGSRDQLG
jgi:predicted dehydrogenase